VEAVVKYADLIHLDCDKDVFCRTELRAISTAYKKKRWIPNWITHDKERRAGSGEFYLPEVKELFKTGQITPYKNKAVALPSSSASHNPMDTHPMDTTSQRLVQKHSCAHVIR